MKKKEKKEKKEKKKGRLVFVVIILVLLAILAAVIVLSSMRGREGTGAPRGRGMAFGEKEIVFAVNVTPVVLGPIVDYFKTNGEVVTASSVEVYADVSGILTRRLVGIGDFVPKNRIVAEVDPSRPGVNYALSPVKAPVAGTVITLPLDVGDLVGPGIPVIIIGNLNHLRVVTAVSERFISKVRPGMFAEVTVEAWPDYVLSLQIDEIDPVVDPASRSLEIVMDLPAGENLIKAGMYAEIKLITTEKDEVLRIPAHTVLRRGDETYVYIVQDEKAVKRPVVEGIVMNDLLEVVSGLDEGDKVVSQGQTLLEEGVTVRVIREENLISAETVQD